MASRPEYVEEVQMHYVKAKGILSSKNGMNLYRGCTHGCIYCDSRSTCYQMNHAFEDIEVKENALELLEDSLRRKRKKCMIGTGAMSDPYMPLEKQLLYTRKSLELIEKYGFGAAVQTKSNLILRDLDILFKIHQKTRCVVQMTLTTLDEDLCRKVEPNVCTTRERVRVLKVMQEYGIPTVVWLCPILPFINDTEENVSGIVELCADAGVYGILCFDMGLTLREGNREYFYRQLDRYFPGIKEKYIRTYGNAYQISSPDREKLMRLFHERCRTYGIETDMEKIWEYLYYFEEKQKVSQMSLFEMFPDIL